MFDNEFSFAIIKLTFEKDIYEKELKTDKGTIMINKIYNFNKE